MKRFALGLCFIALSIALISYGVVRGEADTAYKKARAICLECIGIG